MAKAKPEEGESKQDIDTGSEGNGVPGATGEGEASTAAGDTAITEENKSPEGNDGVVGNAEPQEPENVRLVDWPPEREGIHTVHTKDGIFSFINGVATFKAEVASKLREAGYIE